MATHEPPPPPPMKADRPGKAARIADMRYAFARKRPQTAQDRAAAKAFIEGKMEMMRGDPQLTEEQKAAATAELEARRDVGDKKGKKSSAK